MVTIKLKKSIIRQLMAAGMKLRFSNGIIIRIASTLLLVYPVFAQADADSGVIQNTLTSSGSNSFFSGPKNRINVEIAKDKKTASFKFKTWSLSNIAKTSLEIKAPFDKSSGESLAGISDGLGDATSVVLGLDFISIDTLLDDPLATEDGKKLCVRYMLKSHNENCSSGNVKEESKKFFHSLNTEQQKTICLAYNVPIGKCNEEQFPTTLAKQYSKQRQSIWGKGTKAWLFPVRIEYGQSDFKYLDLNTFNEESATKNPYSASVGFGRLTHNLFWGGGYEYKKVYKAASQKEYCTPVPTSATATQCEATNFGPPDETINRNIFLEARYRPKNENYAFAIKLTKDTENNQESIEIPIYLLESIGMGLNAGVKLAWNSEDKDIVSMFFFGTSFSYFK